MATKNCTEVTEACIQSFQWDEKTKAVTHWVKLLNAQICFTTLVLYIFVYACANQQTQHRKWVI